MQKYEKSMRFYIIIIKKSVFSLMAAFQRAHIFAVARAANDVNGKDCKVTARRRSIVTFLLVI